MAGPSHRPSRLGRGLSLGRVDVIGGVRAGSAREPSRSNATWPTPPRARSRTTPSAVASSPVLPTTWTAAPARAAASATRDDMPAAAMAPSLTRPMGEPMTTITREAYAATISDVSAGASPAAVRSRRRRRRHRGRPCRPGRLAWVVGCLGRAWCPRRARGVSSGSAVLAGLTVSVGSGVSAGSVKSVG